MAEWFVINRFVSIMKISTNRSAAVVAEVSKFLILSGVVLAFVFFQLATAPVPKGWYQFSEFLTPGGAVLPREANRGCQWLRLGAIKLSAAAARFFRALRGTNQGVGLLTMKWFKKTAQGFSPGSRHQGTRPERATDERCFFQEAALIPSLATIGSTITRNGDLSGQPSTMSR